MGAFLETWLKWVILSLKCNFHLESCYDFERSYNWFNRSAFWIKQHHECNLYHGFDYSWSDAVTNILKNYLYTYSFSVFIIIYRAPAKANIWIFLAFITSYLLDYLSLDNSEVMLCIKTNRKGTNESLRSSKSVSKAPMKVMFNQIAFSIFQEISFESTYKILCFGSVFIVFQVLSFLNERIYHRC